MASINESIAGLATQAKYAVSNTVSAVDSAVKSATSSVSKFLTNPLSGRPSISSTPLSLTPATATFVGDKQDTRVKLIVPDYYLTTPQLRGPEDTLNTNGGIIFPYTPTISQEYAASYNEVSPTHSNFKQYFYKNSFAGPISITAEFTSQNEFDAGMYLSTINMLRLLTKMKWGDDENAGAPPPVCRLMAYGDQMFNNVPVAVQTFRIDLPKNVDYIDTGALFYNIYGVNSVPIIATMTINLIPIFSRDEQMQYSVDIAKEGRNNKGYV